MPTAETTRVAPLLLEPVHLALAHWEVQLRGKALRLAAHLAKWLEDLGQQLAELKMLVQMKLHTCKEQQRY